MDEKKAAAERDSKSSLSAKSKKSKSKSPTKNESPVKSGKSGKSLKSSSKSKSPKRRLTGKESKNDFLESSYFDSAPKSTPELEDLTGQGLTALSSKLFQKFTLRTLILSGNNLRSLPPEIADLINLEYLDLSKNPLRVKDVDDVKCLPLDMRLLRNLKYLSISECNLRYIPTTVWLCISLEKLDISRNKIGLLVPDVGNLQRLTHLNLSQCNLTTLPVEIGFCSELAEILLMANQIESLPDSLKDCIKLESLKMSYRTFTALLDSYMENLISKGQIRSEHVPIVVFELENLRILDLKFTKINNLPENCLRNLHELCLDNNYFEKLSDLSMRSMSQSLRILSMSKNLLKEIPNEILDLPNIEKIDLSFNHILDIPGRMNLPNLKEFLLNDNNLKTVAGSVSVLQKLEIFNLEKNQITDVADLVFEIKSLKYFDLSYNKLTHISPKISKLQLLQNSHSYEKLNKTGLWVIGNPLIIPPKNIWQTSNLSKIYEYLSGYNQRNLSYTYYSKLIFLGRSGTGKSNLVNCFFNNQRELNLDSKEDFRTLVARKFYKRTFNKVEWMILDFGGNELYKLVHSLFFSSIDHETEPTIFVIVYKHSEYNAENHDQLIGTWINSVLLHSNFPNKNSINIKLIGITEENQSEQDINEKLTVVKENSSRSVKDYFEKLKKMKFKIENLLNDSSVSDENKSYLKTVKTNIDKNVNTRVKIYEQVTLIDCSLRKKSVEKVINDLEKITIQLNKTVPLELNRILKCFVPTLKTKVINNEEFVENLNSNQELVKLLKSSKKIKITTNDVFNYAKTIGEIFWPKFDANSNSSIFLHYEYILNCLRLFIRHDLNDYLLSDKIKLFNTCGFFGDNVKYQESVDLFHKYGILEDKLFRFISFSLHQMDYEQVNESVDILNQFMILYKSETQYLEDECPFFQIALPFKCTADFEKEKNLIASVTNTYDSDLYADDFYKYFIRFDKICSRREEIKELNSLRKQKELWSPNENEYLDEFEDSERQSRSSSLGKSQIEAVQFNYFQELENFKILPDQDFKDIFKLTAIYEISSLCQMEWHFFSKFSVLIQDLVFERFDWQNVIIARDLNGTCMRIKSLGKKDNDEYSIQIEIFCQDITFLDELKNKLGLILEKLAVSYPGLFFTKKFLLYE